MARKGIQAVLGYRCHTHKGEHYEKYRFRYDPEHDGYLCPEHHPLPHKTTNRLGYREYKGDPKTCANCPRWAQCFSEKARLRQVQRHIWQDDLDQADAFTKTPRGRRLYALRKLTVEPSFAEAKDNHAFRTARMKGLPNMREQAFLPAAVQNMKRIACGFCVRFALFSLIPYSNAKRPLSAGCIPSARVGFLIVFHQFSADSVNLLEFFWDSSTFILLILLYNKVKPRGQRRLGNPEQYQGRR